MPSRMLIYNCACWLAKEDRQNGSAESLNGHIRICDIKKKKRGKKIVNDGSLLSNFSLLISL